MFQFSFPGNELLDDKYNSNIIHLEFTPLMVTPDHFFIGILVKSELLLLVTLRLTPTTAEIPAKSE